MTLVGLTAVEALVINSKMEFLGISQKHDDYASLDYIKHNLANAFPTVSRLLNLSVDTYIEQGPMIEATNISALLALAGLIGQNYVLSQKFHAAKYPVIESFILLLGAIFLRGSSV